MNLSDIKGIGTKTEHLLNKLGVYTPSDLISYYPYRYETIKRSNINEIHQGDKIITDGIVETNPLISYFCKNKNRLSFNLFTGTNLLQVILFNRSFLKNNLNIGTEVTIIGKYDKEHNKIIASEVRFGKIKKETIECIYHVTSGLTNRMLTSYIDTSLTDITSVKQVIPEDISLKYHFLSKVDSVIAIHKPVNKEQLIKARQRLIYEELFEYMLKVNYIKNKRVKTKGIKRDKDMSLLNNMIASLPFTLTDDQLQSFKEIMHDLKSPYQMNRLLQGDVGSGKTIVAALSIYVNYLSGYESAFMVPTEILAHQHYEKLLSLFKNTNIKIALLTGKMKKSERSKVLIKLKEGQIDVIIGTHALISDDVVYNNLGLIVTDEQHRFGVQQRTSLKNKGIMPDMLSMSATPIPRTYALTVYGDMDVSNIKTKPVGRKPIITLLKKEKDIKEVLTSMYKELNMGHQVYVIAPLIEDSETLKNDVVSLSDNMKKAFGKKFKIGTLHGQMPACEKEDIMNKFSSNDIQILISTTIIEVGVDVANATMMVIFNAEQFGLSTIHQLRGRVGRNNLQSYCFLISNYAKERLDILTKTDDGFVISEEDFRLRGSGDLFGSRQSGDMLFKIASLKRDFKMLELANKDSMQYLNSKDLSDFNLFDDANGRLVS